MNSRRSRDEINLFPTRELKELCTDCFAILRYKMTMVVNVSDVKFKNKNNNNNINNNSNIII